LVIDSKGTKQLRVSNDKHVWTYGGRRGGTMKKIFRMRSDIDLFLKMLSWLSNHEGYGEWGT